MNFWFFWTLLLAAVKLCSGTYNFNFFLHWLTGTPKYFYLLMMFFFCLTLKCRCQ